MNLYAVLNVKEACKEMMDEHYHLALNYLNAIRVEEDRKQTLLKFTDLLMVREN